MNTRLMPLLAAAAMSFACSRNGASNSADHAARTAGDLGNALVNGAAAAGHGVVCGAREFGQTLSGTQGDPRAEALSQRACNHASDHANQADRDLDRAGTDVNATARPSSAQGGGPRR